ncbi:MAG: ribonuclease D, partial [Arenicellales bacterium]|nr:ribonuclease D [Arenicellales bacterium]
MRCHLIKTQIALETLFEKLSSTQVIALDTEFLRVRTYYPKLCLVQIASHGEVYCIDPLAVDLGIDQVRDILIDAHKTKILHAGRQDIEVLYAHCGQVPLNVFDTQVAAAMLGLGDQIGYADLVELFTGKSLEK